MFGFLSQIADQYERTARVLPGLLVVIPVAVPLVVVFGPKHPLLASVVGLLFGCGALYALASIARGRGKELEGRLVKKWGGMPTTIALRHRDSHLDSVTKARYHDTFRRVLGIEMPSAAEETANPEGADQAYEAVARQLRERTRAERGLLLKENIAYGFHRNMLAMKPLGVLSSVIGIIWGLALSKGVRLTSPYFDVAAFENPGLPAVLTLMIAGAMLLAWLFHFNERAVRRIGFAYAERLFECGQRLKSGRQRVAGA